MQTHKLQIRKTILNFYQKEISDFEKKSATRSIVLYMQVYAAIMIAISIGIFFNNPIITMLMMMFIAGRQHSLYILNHDASHYLLFKSKKFNKSFATIFSNLVMFHHPEAWSFVQWRRVHLKHHSFLFTPDDPNYVGRQLAGDTERTYSKLALIWACLLVMPKNFMHFFLGKEDYVCPNSHETFKASRNHLAVLFIPFGNDPEMESERKINILFYVIALTCITYFKLWSLFILFWIAPMYVFYPMILKFHDLTEHYWEKKSIDPLINTRSEKRGFLIKLVFSFLPRQFHLEHHLFPRIAVICLPKVHRLLERLK